MGNYCAARMKATPKYGYTALGNKTTKSIKLSSKKHEKKENTSVNLNGLFDGHYMIATACYICKHCGCLFVEDK
jgi:hypothetical protein